jgi:uncharacterized membrane protein YtjA (UPF0391 family)
MFNALLAFVALILAVLLGTGMAVLALWIARILLGIFAALFLISLVHGRRPSPKIRR